jgi:ankyrin repeat protein
MVLEDVEAVQKALAEGVNLNEILLDGSTLFGHAVRSVNVLQVCLDSGQDPNRANRFGRTPLHAAARNGLMQSVNLLVQSGRVDPTLEDGQGRTPRYWAEKNGHNEIAKVLEVYEARWRQLQQQRTVNPELAR